MSEYINRDDLLQRLNRIDDEGNDDKRNALALAIYAVQVAESVDIVMCKDCEKYGTSACYMAYTKSGSRRTLFSNGFCCYGKGEDDECE